MDEKDTINLVNECYEESSSVWRDWFTECDEDYKFYMSDQWSESDKSELARKGRPILSLNYLKKNVDIISGHERQNKSDIKVLPIEGSDSYIAEILTTTIKWIMLQGNNEFVRSQAFKDALIGGIGWMEPVMSFDEDPINGDIYLRKISPFDMMIDPHFSELDLSDADYIIRHKFLSKEKAKLLYSSVSDAIDRSKGVSTSDVVRHQSVPNDRGKKILVVEYWHKTYDPVKFLVNPDDPADTHAWEGTKDELAVVLASNPRLKTITKKVPRIKLTTVLDKNVLAFDGAAPNAKKMWPFIPIFCFCETSYPDMKLKTQGIIRSLKDVQREKNKRRSNIMAAIGTMPHSGWMLPKGGVDDINVLRNSAGAGKVIEYNAQKGAPSPIGPIEISQSLVQLEMMFADDMRQIGANPDLLGIQQGKNDPGITIQLRQKQGLTAIQEIYDSLSYATRILGRKVIEMMGENWNNEKIKRIAGDYLPFDERREDIKKEIKNMQAQYMQVQSPSSAGLMPENEEEERMLLDIETQQMAAENQKMQIQQQIQDLEGLVQSVTDEENEFWTKFDTIRQTSRFDVAIDETASSPTSRIANLSSLTQAAQYGVAVPPEAIVELLDISKTQKDRILEYIQQQQQQMAQMPPQKK